MERTGGCIYWAHAGKLSTGKALRAVRLCLFFSCCFAHHAGAFLGGVGVRGGIHRAATRASRQAGRLRWRHRGSLAARLVFDFQEHQLAASTYSRACGAYYLRYEKASDSSGTTQVSTVTIATAKAAVPSSAPAAATVAAPATTPTISNSTAPSFLAAVEEKTNRNNAGEEVVLYFAFGANMSPSVLTGKRGVTPVKSAPAQAVAFATSDERKKRKHGRKTVASPAECEQDEKGKDGEDGEGRICLSFSHRAGYATIAQIPGPSQSWAVSPGVHGVLHAVSPSDMERISGFETGYRKCTVEVVTSAGERYRAICFVSNPTQLLPTSVPPTSRYLKLLQAGASHHGVDERYQSWLARLPSVPSKEAEASPERTNTPSKVLLNRVLALSAVVAAGLAAIELSGVFVNNP